MEDVSIRGGRGVSVVKEEKIKIVNREELPGVQRQPHSIMTKVAKEALQIKRRFGRRGGEVKRRNKI